MRIQLNDQWTKGSVHSIYCSNSGQQTQDQRGLGLDSHCWLGTEVPGKLPIPAAYVYLVLQKVLKWE